MIFILTCLAFVVFMVAALWKIYAKAGKPGWAAIVPIYNIIVLLEIAGRPGWWIVLMFVPIANFIVSIIVAIDVAKAFGKGTGFGLGLAFLGPIFYPILGFGAARHGGGSKAAA